MSRPLRIQFPGAVYHVMNRGGARQATFLDDDDYQALLDTLAERMRMGSGLSCALFVNRLGDFLFLSRDPGLLHNWRRAGLPWTRHG